MSDRIAQTEAYQGTGLESINIVLEGAQEGINSLTQNEPNPWKSETVIKFGLANAGTVKLLVHDISGRLIFSQSGEYTSGYNQMILNEEDLSVSGVLYYTLESEAYVETKKMVLIE